MKTHSLIFQWQRIVISNHTAQHIAGLIRRKLRCYPCVKPVKMSRIRCSVCKCSWRARERFPGPVAAHRHRKKRESREAGAQRYLAMTFTCSPSHTESFGFVQINTGCPCVMLLWSQLFTQASVTLSWSPSGARCSSQLISLLHDLTFHDCGISPGHISFWPMQHGSSVLN